MKGQMTEAEVRSHARVTQSCGVHASVMWCACLRNGKMAEAEMRNMLRHARLSHVACTP